MRAGLKVRLDRLERQIEKVILSAEHLPDSVLSAPPYPGTWSPLHAVQHLVLVHEGAAAILARAAAPVTLPHRSSWWRPAAMRFVLRAGIRIKAPTSRVVPVAAVPLNALAGRWAAAQAGLRGELETKGARWGNDALFRHPLAGWLDTTQTLDFLSDHIEHHRRQVRGNSAPA